MHNVPCPDSWLKCRRNIHEVVRRDRVLMIRRILAVGFWIVALLSGSLAQNDANSQTSAASAAPPEKSLGNYVMSQSVEFGYRFADVTGEEVSPGGPTNLSM